MYFRAVEHNKRRGESLPEGRGEGVRPVHHSKPPQPRGLVGFEIGQIGGGPWAISILKLHNQSGFKNRLKWAPTV